MGHSNTHTTTTPGTLNHMSKHTGARALIAQHLHTKPKGHQFTLTELQAAIHTDAHNLSRRLRELRETGWDIPHHGNGTYTLQTKGALPGTPEWNTGRQNINQKTRRTILERDNSTCQKCGAGTEQRLTIGHIIPVETGGTNDPTNLQTECAPCNEPWRNQTYNPAERLEQLQKKHGHLNLQNHNLDELQELVALLKHDTRM